nr:GNAT family N-acetyltransferase [Paenibacillus apiarius]
MIGVKQDEQGKGIGKALLHHLLNMVKTDMNWQGVALDMENEVNVNLYRRFGFTLNRFDHVHVYCMFYQKQSPCREDSDSC